MSDKTTYTLHEIEERVKAFVPDSKYEHDHFALATVEEALATAMAGNVGVGAVIVDAQGEIIQRGRNRQFHPYFRSDIHGEMDALNSFEDRFKDATNMRDYMLFTSLEPCPMCLIRLITAGLGHVYHAAPDVDNGMVHRIKDLGPAWVELAEMQVFEQARCSPALSEISLDIFQATFDDYVARIMARR